MSERKHSSDWSILPENVFKFMESRTASNSAMFLLPTIKQMREHNPRLRLLDVGAGVGSMSIEFAQIIGLEGHVTAVDVNPVVIPRGQALAEKHGVTNISFETAGGHKLPYEDETFDIVHCHQVLTHNKDPWDILREMIRVTKPGGVVAAREGDLDTEVIWPPIPGVLKFHEEFEIKIITDRGGHRDAGRQLLSWALRAGARREQVTTSFSTWSYTEPEDRMLWASGMIGIALGPNLRESNIKAGVPEKDMDIMLEGWTKWMKLDNAVLAMLHGEVIIRK
ncbi:S-adenosyl-L-methionine-dependent methyltransferase [Xylaria arbuscula]|nr:S-adenosyl-L-methionine-dependent methyltransferase [Xylaria arbuscula]